MRSQYALCLAVLFLVAANVQADTIFTLKTGGDWTVKHYGTLGTSHYGEIDNETIIGMINSGGENYNTGRGTRVYDSTTSQNVLDELKKVWDMSDGDGAPWIGIWNGESENNETYADTYNSWNLSGYYTFETSFTLDGGLGKMSLNVWSDNDLMGIYLTNSSGGLWGFSIDSVAEDYYLGPAFATSINDAGFEAGEYTLTFFLTNGLQPDTEFYAPGTALPGGWDLPHGPVGLRVETPSTVVPEPATIAVIGLGLAGLGLARARRKR